VIEGFESRQGLGIFLFTTSFTQALGPTQPPIQRVPGARSLGVKRPGREAYHSPQSSAESRMRGAIPPLPNTLSWRDVRLKHTDNFTFTLTCCFFAPRSKYSLQYNFLHALHKILYRISRSFEYRLGYNPQVETGSPVGIDSGPD
jgi:hypothetical protein